MFTPQLPSTALEAVVSGLFVASAVAQATAGVRVVKRSARCTDITPVVEAPQKRRELRCGLWTYAGFMACSGLLYGVGRMASYHNFLLEVWMVLAEQALWLSVASLTVIRAMRKLPR